MRYLYYIRKLSDWRTLLNWNLWYWIIIEWSRIDYCKNYEEKWKTECHKFSVVTKIYCHHARDILWCSRNNLICFWAHFPNISSLNWWYKKVATILFLIICISQLSGLSYTAQKSHAVISGIKQLQRNNLFVYVFLRIQSRLSRVTFCGIFGIRSTMIERSPSIKPRIESTSLSLY